MKNQLESEDIVTIAVVAMLLLFVFGVIALVANSNIKNNELKKELIKEVTKQVIELEKAKESSND